MTTAARELPALHDVQLHAGDCLAIMERLPPRSVDLAYLDPPFNTGRTHSAGTASFDDRFADIDAYLEFIMPRMRAVQRLLRPHGAVLLHCDWRTCHHLCCLLERLFGADAFVNHLIWSYGLGGSSPRRFARKHDDILFFVNGPQYVFEPPLVPATSRRMHGRLKKATDVLSIPSINNMAKERVGYPTQKPLALLELLVGACAPPGGTVLDPFCGSGTTLIAARRLDRRAIGIDRNPDALAITRERLERERLAPS